MTTENIMETLLKTGEYVEFLIEFEGDTEYSANFKVYEVISWTADDIEPSETELYLKGLIKWDGCSHIWFGDSDGYIHLCGKSMWDKHVRVMNAIWELCRTRITSFDENVSS